MESLWGDVRLSVRGLLRTPGITAAALLALALGIGANTALFSVASATLWRDLPFQDPDRLVLISEESPGATMVPGPVTPHLFHEWRRRSEAFSGIAGMSHTRRNLTDPGKPELVQVSAITANYLEVTGAKLIAGRGFREEEARRRARVALISERLYRERFGSDPGRLKQGIVLDGIRHGVVGVAPPRFAIYGDWDVWLPMAFQPVPENRGRSFVRVLGRLAPGVSPERAERELETIVGGLARRELEIYTNWLLRLRPVRTDRLIEVHGSLKILGLLVVFVLLIACADVAGLLLARATAREREIALQAVLGASRARLVRRLLAESLLLFLTGGLLGFFLALWGTPILAGLSPKPLTDAQIGLDGRVLLFALAVSLATGLVFGLLPALAATGRRLSEAIQEGRGLAGRPGGRWLRDALVAGQVALTLVLAIAAGLNLQSFDRLRNVDPGFRTGGTLGAAVQFPWPPAEGPALRAERYSRLVRALAAVPKVEAAALVDWLPFSEDQIIGYLVIEGRPDPPPEEIQAALMRRISPEYFRVMGISLSRGRLFEESDTAGSVPVVVVNESLAERCWPGEDPIGKRIQVSTEEWVTVAGVVKDTRQDELAGETFLEVYLPFAQRPHRYSSLLIRAPGHPADWEGVVRQAVRSVEPGLAVGPLQTLEERLDTQLAPDRFKSLMATLFAILAMLLAAIGIYGVISYSVARRTHEIGIRVALGAGEGAVLGQVIREGMRPVLTGVALGLAIALPLSRLLEDQLYEVPARDFATYLAAMVGVLCVGLVANYFPAHEATRVEPMAALRDD
ncbi:MAG TPA: ABC transporter permease [Thermoanaerobaculia bacterium]|nr:ABC transporter permease [Thermoanaerobaculia bacterium]